MASLGTVLLLLLSSIIITERPSAAAERCRRQGFDQQLPEVLRGLGWKLAVRIVRQRRNDHLVALSRRLSAQGVRLDLQG